MEWETSDIKIKSSKKWFKSRDAKEEAAAADGGLKTSPKGGHTYRHIKGPSWQWGAKRSSARLPKYTIQSSSSKTREKISRYRHDSIIYLENCLCTQAGKPFNLDWNVDIIKHCGIRRYAGFWYASNNMEQKTDDFLKASCWASNLNRNFLFSNKQIRYVEHDGKLGCTIQ